MTNEWTNFRLRVNGVEELMLERDDTVYRDDDWFCGCALVALADHSDRYAEVIDEDPETYDDWVSFQARQEDGIWLVRQDGEKLGAEQNLDEAIAEVCSLQSVDLNPWHPKN